MISNVYNKSLATAQAMNANFSTSAQALYQMYGYYITVVVTGTPTGTLKLEASADPFDVQDSDYIPTNWDVVGSSSVAITAAGTTSWNVIGAMYNYVRVTYTDGSAGTSTATCAIRINAKG